MANLPRRGQLPKAPQPGRWARAYMSSRRTSPKGYCGGIRAPITINRMSCTASLYLLTAMTVPLACIAFANASDVGSNSCSCAGLTRISTPGTATIGIPAGGCERAARLYEQGREQPNGCSRLGMYVRRWVGWATGGLSSRRTDDSNARPGSRRRPTAADAAGATAIMPPVRALSPGS